jgi:hypothetical protein
VKEQEASESKISSFSGEKVEDINEMIGKELRRKL